MTVFLKGLFVSNSQRVSITISVLFMQVQQNANYKNKTGTAAAFYPNEPGKCCNANSHLTSNHTAKKNVCKYPFLLKLLNMTLLYLVS